MLCEEIYNLLAKKIPNDNILKNEPMTKHTSFKIGGNAEVFVKANNIEEVKFILDICKRYDIPLTIVGNGSNLLVKDSGIMGIVMKINIDNISIEDCSLNSSESKIISNIIDNNKKQNIENTSENNIKSNIENTKENNIENNIKNTSESNIENSSQDDYVIVTVGAGVPLGKLAQILLKKSISGFEFASGIPGTIGGAVRMNAGAYGSEFKDIVFETTCINMDGEVFKLNNEQQKFGYRRSIFKDEKFVILEAKLLLRIVNDNEQIKNKMDEYKKSRLEKQPIEFPSAGSTFKRGEDFITAKLIDECGLKGFCVGGAQVSNKHAGFVINTGGATAEDVLRLVEIIKESVLQKCGKSIELEIEVIG